MFETGEMNELWLAIPRALEDWINISIENFHFPETIKIVFINEINPESTTTYF